MFHRFAIRRPTLAISIAAVWCLLGLTSVRAQIFADGLSNGANWTIVQTADASAEFGFDYSSKGIPRAPRGSDSIGLKFEVNNNWPSGSEWIRAYHVNSEFTGKYTLRVDVWLNWALVDGSTGSGTTEHAGVAVGSPFRGISPFQKHGAALRFNGDGDEATDYALLKDNRVQSAETNQYALGSAWPDLDASNPILAHAFPSIDVAATVPSQGQNGATNDGAAGFQWITVNVEVDTDASGPAGATADPGVAHFTLRSAASRRNVDIGTIDNSNRTFDSDRAVIMFGAITLFAEDNWPSVTANPALDFIIFDNVEVFRGLVPLPEPNAGVLLLMAIASHALRRGQFRD